MNYEIEKLDKQNFISNMWYIWGEGNLNKINLKPLENLILKDKILKG